MVFKICEGMPCTLFYAEDFDVVVHKEYFPRMTLLNFWPFCTLHHQRTWWVSWELGTVTNIFSYFFSNVKHHLPIDYHVHIWHVSPQHSCSDTRKFMNVIQTIYMYFYKLKISLTNGALVAAASGATQCHSRRTIMGSHQSILKWVYFSVFLTVS